LKLCWAKYILWTTITIFGVATMVTSCGQKGPLYLPHDNTSAKKYSKTKTQKEPEKKQKEPSKK